MKNLIRTERHPIRGASPLFWKRGISLLLALLMVVSLITGVLGAESSITEITDAMSYDTVGTYSGLSVYLCHFDSTVEGYTIALTATYLNVYPATDATGDSYANNVYHEPIVRGSVPSNSAASAFASVKSALGISTDEAKNDYYLYLLAKPGPPIPPIFGGNKGWLLIEWEKGAQVDKTELQKAIQSAPTAEDTLYFHENDRYNGSITSENSFWTDMQMALSAAKEVDSNAVATQNAIDNAAETLRQAIANLIPTSQVNPTGLYETLNLYSEEDAKDYSLDSWTAFAGKRDEAQELLDSLFTKDAEGNVTATEENSSAKHPQADVDALVEALKGAKAGLDTRVHSLLQAVTDNALAGISLYAGYYDTLSADDYTSDSWQAYVTARANALNTAKEHGTFTSTMGVSEVGIQADAFNRLRSAYFSLVPKAETITVHVSLTDELAAKKATSISKKLNMRTYTRTVNAGTTVADVMTSTYKNENVWRVNSMSKLMVYVNGTMCFSCRAGSL